MPEIEKNYVCSDLIGTKFNKTHIATDVEDRNFGKINVPTSGIVYYLRPVPPIAMQI